MSIGVSILHTNDMHGRLTAMSRLSTHAARLREAAVAEGRTVLFWDAGDALDRRDRLCALSKGAALARVLNAMGYGLMTMGNDILLTYGPTAMAELVSRLEFPVLAANCRDQDAPPAAGLGEAASVRLEGGPALGVIGVTAPWGGWYDVFGLRFPNTHDTVDRLVRRLRSEGASVIAVLSHLGLKDDLALAKAVPGIDLIIGAHSHDVLERGREENGVLIAQAGQYAEHLGIVELEIDPENGTLRSRTARVERIPEGVSPDPAVEEAVAEAAVEVDSVAARRIGVLTDDLDLDYHGECRLGDLAADALRERMQSEAAFLISGQLQQGLRAGDLTFGQICECSSITANPQRSRVRGQQILDALERSLDPSSIESRPGALRGPQVGWLQVSGLRLEYDPQRPIGGKITSAVVGDLPLDPQRLYQLAHTDAETSEQTGLLRLDPGQETSVEVPTITREVLEEYIRAHSPIAAPQGGRWVRRGGLA